MKVKYIFFSVLMICLLAVTNTNAQVPPQGINYQAVARNSSGNILVSQSVTLRATVLSGSASGTAQWIETHAVTTNQFGLINVTIGQGTRTGGAQTVFANIDWASGKYFLKIEMDAGSGYSDMGTTQLQAVPYSFVAGKATNMKLDDLTDVSTSGVTDGQVLKYDNNSSSWKPGNDNSAGGNYNAGTGIDITGTTITNTAPDKTVVLTGTGATSVTGTYPNFTISSTDNNTTYVAGTNISITGGNTINNTAPDKTVSITGTGATSVTGTYPNFTVSSTDNNTTYTAGSGLALTGTSFSLAQQSATNGQVLQWNGASWAPATPGAGSSWNLTGNSGTSAGTNYIGTSDGVDLVIKTNGTERFRVLSGGNIGIGTTTPSYMLHMIGSAGTGSSVAVISNNNAAGVGLTGQNLAASGASTGVGVYGATQQSNGFGVYATNLSAGGTGILGVGNNLGSYTLPTGGAGGAFYGTANGAYGFATGNGGYGVYGRADNVSSAYGVIGRANNVLGAGPSQGSGGMFIGNSYGVTGYQYTTTGQTAGGYFISGDGAGGATSTTLVEAFSSGGTHYKIWQNVVGSVATSVPDLNNQPATLHAIETPEFYFQDYGQAKLVNGQAHIDIDPILAKNVAINEKHPLRVFIQLEGDCKGVYVTNKTATGFDVIELGGGNSNVTFQWSVTCNVADAVIGGRVSPFADLRFEPGPVSNLKQLPIDPLK